MLVKKALEQAKASIELEGNYITAEQKELVEKVIRKEITDAEFDKRVLELVKKKGEYKDGKKTLNCIKVKVVKSTKLLYNETSKIVLLRGWRIVLSEMWKSGIAEVCVLYGMRK